MGRQFVKVFPETMFDAALTAAEFRLLCILRYHANRRGEAWPSQTTLARELNMSQSGVSKIVKSLTCKGRIQASPRDVRPTGNITYTVTEDTG